MSDAEASEAAELSDDGSQAVDDFDEGVNDDFDSSSEDEAGATGGRSGAKKQQPGNGGKKAKPKAKASAGRKAPNGSKKCFAAGCTESKKGKARFCAYHRPMADSIKSQGEAAGKLQEAEQLLNDEAKCAMALQQWERDNPPGKYRKKLIDWSQWQRQFKIKTVVIVREGQTQWTWDELVEEKGEAGWPAERILAKWNSWEKDSNVEQDWDNGKNILWVPDRKRRIRDLVKEVNNSYVESSKQMKKVKLADANSLKDFCHLGQARFNDQFFKGDAKEDEAAAGASAAGHSLAHSGDAEGQGNKSAAKGKVKMVDMSSAAPDEYQSQIDSLKKLKDGMQDAVAKAMASLETADRSTDWNPAGTRYLRTCKVRHACAVIFLSDGIGGAEQALLVIQEVEVERRQNPTPGAKLATAAPAPSTPKAGRSPAALGQASGGSPSAVESAAAAQEQQLQQQLQQPNAAAGAEAAAAPAQKRIRLKQKKAEPSAAAAATDGEPEEGDTDADVERANAAGEEMAADLKSKEGTVDMDVAKKEESEPEALQQEEEPVTVDVANGAATVAAASTAGTPTKATTPSKQSPSKIEKSEKRWRSSPVVSQLTSMLRRACHADGSVRIPVQTPDELWAYSDLAAWIEKTIDIETAEELDDTRRHWAIMSSMARQLKTGVVKASQKLKSHLETKVREAARKQKSQHAAQTKSAVAAAKAKAKAAAVKVQQQSMEGSALFKLTPAQLHESDDGKTNGKQLTATTEFQTLTQNLHEPVLMACGGYEVHKKWTQLPKVQLALSAFGGEYRRQKSTQSSGSCQRVLECKQGKEETDAMLQQLATSLQLDKVAADLSTSPAKAIQEQTWMFGYEPGHEFCGLGSQALAFIKVQVFGDAAFMTFSASSLSSAWEAAWGSLTSETLEQKVLSLSCDDFKTLQSKGCQVYSGKLSPGMSLFAPTCWVLIERAVPTSRLVYGVRKSYVIRSAVAHSEYDSALKINAASGKQKIASFRKEVCKGRTGQ